MGEAVRAGRNSKRGAGPERAAGTRDSASDRKILAAAKELFLADGYDGVAVERVAERAGVSRQTVYNRFGAKEAVFREMVVRHWATFAGTDRATGAGTGAGAAEVLRGFARSLQRFATETDQIRFARLVVTESGRRPWIAGEFYRVGKGPVVAAFAGVLDDLVRGGRLECRDTSLAARQFMGLVQEFLVWPRVMGFEEETAAQPAPEVVVEEAISTFLARYVPLPHRSPDGPPGALPGGPERPA